MSQFSSIIAQSGQRIAVLLVLVLAFNPAYATAQTMGMTSDGHMADVMTMVGEMPCELCDDCDDNNGMSGSQDCSDMCALSCLSGSLVYLDASHRVISAAKSPSYEFDGDRYSIEHTVSYIPPPPRT